MPVEVPTVDNANPVSLSFLSTLVFKLKYLTIFFIQMKVIRYVIKSVMVGYDFQFEILIKNTFKLVLFYKTFFVFLTFHLILKIPHILLQLKSCCYSVIMLFYSNMIFIVLFMILS